LVWSCLVEDTPCNAHYDSFPHFSEAAYIVPIFINRYCEDSICHRYTVCWTSTTLTSSP
jgi:hypothetical protein